VTPSGRVRKYCYACARITDRARRRAAGGTARRVRTPPGDPTRIYAA
jgi:hypothetical protein